MQRPIPRVIGQDGDSVAEGIGQTLPKGADLCVQFHYHRTGKEEKDRTKIGLYFAKGPIEQKYRSVATAAQVSPTQMPRPF